MAITRYDGPPFNDDPFDNESIISDLDLVSDGDNVIRFALAETKKAFNAIQDNIADLDAFITAIQANDWVTTARILDDAVTTSKIADNSISASKLLAGIITRAHLNPDIYATNAEALAGTDGTAVMTPLRTEQHGDARYRRSSLDVPGNNIAPGSIEESRLAAAVINKINQAIATANSANNQVITGSNGITGYSWIRYKGGVMEQYSSGFDSYTTDSSGGFYVNFPMTFGGLTYNMTADAEPNDYFLVPGQVSRDRHRNYVFVYRRDNGARVNAGVGMNAQWRAIGPDPNPIT